jgi:hypothetical protein
MSSQELDELLGALREQTRGAEAPERVETALLRAFLERSQTRARLRWIGWAAATAFVMLGTGVWLRTQQEVPPPAVVRLAPPVPAVAPPVLLPAAPELPVSKRVRPRRPSVEPPAPAEPVQEVATDFLPLEDTLSLAPIESGQILRVRLPQSAMMRFGFPVNPDRMLEPVKADVVFGQDGIARAVRFVR